ncbi:hypothetical protein [Oceanicella sp. SM1341]|uniref:hypothetical protein n=1 Tax=Oceanicella sp. SM1341 TaxID=1548889 RepID=UPI000E5436D8|nr:hypothetical protein [Oceanicella sp. SM1341]
MGFGAIITTGDDNLPLPDSLAQWLAEVRVEEELSRPTKFALRFEDDLCGDRPAVEGRPEIAANAMVSVLVPDGNALACLVRGRITRVESTARVGGVGSSLTAHGESRKVEMDRETVQATWEGQEAQIVTSILQGYGFEPKVADVTTRTYTAAEQLNQRGTDLALLDKIAGENGVEFWLSYKVSPPPPLPPGAGYGIEETAHFRISPEVPSDTPFDIGEFSLTPLDADAPSLRVSVPGDDCPNVNLFRARVESERPNRAVGAAIDAASGETGRTDTSADPATVAEGRTLDALDGVTRTIVTSGPGDDADQSRRDAAALREASWFVEATVSTSAQLLKGRVIRTHQVVNARGAGPRFSIPYQAKTVTHVITAADHMMDMTLRSNVIGEEA